MVGPEDESKIYDDRFIEGHTIQFDIPFNFDVLKERWKMIMDEGPQPLYSPIARNRPWVLILLSSVSKDRYFPQLWGNIGIKTASPI